MDDKIKPIIPILTMPSKESLREVSLEWWGKIGPTCIDQWPKELMDLSIPTQYVEFPMEIAEDFWEAQCLSNFADLAKEVDDKIGWDHKFIRLNSRSPKDGCWPASLPIALSGKDALHFLRVSERALDDVCYFRHILEHKAFICIRDLVRGMSTTTEFRCFVKDGDLIAVTHYDYTNPIPVLEDGGKGIRDSIDTWFKETLSNTLPLKTIVFDVHLRHGDTPLLIEVNPYGLSDPCHFGDYDSVESASTYVQFERPAML